MTKQQIIQKILDKRSSRIVYTRQYLERMDYVTLAKILVSMI